MAPMEQIQWDQYCYRKRMRAYDQFELWIQEGKMIPHGGGVRLLAELFGRGDDTSFLSTMTQEHIDVIDKLCGPHGWVIYKALEARQEAEQ